MPSPFPWEKRMEVRSGIDRAFDLKTSLENHLKTGEPIHPQALALLQKLAQTDEKDGMLRAIEQFSASMKADYVARITKAAYDDLGAFAEVMNYDQPPAYHHQFICDHLMMAERGELTHFTLSAPPGHAKPIWEDSLVIAKPSLKHKPGQQYSKKTRLRDVEPGWFVWTHKKRWKQVSEVHEQGVLPVLRIVTNGGSVIRAERTHPFLTQAGWKEAKDLELADVILTTKPGEKLSAEKDLFEFEGETYIGEYVIEIAGGGSVSCRCLTVEDDNSFVAEGLIVHNSTYASHLFGAWYMGRNPDHQFLQAGNTQDFVDNKISARVRSYIRDPLYQTVFEGITMSKDKSALKEWQLQGRKGSYTGRGVGGAIAGLRANYANVDDPIATREDAESQTQRDKSWDWFEDDFSTRRLPGAPISLTATRWHEDDIIGRLQERQKQKGDDKWEFINLPAIAEEDDPLGRAPGEALWPDFFTLEFLKDLKAESSGKKWNSLYQGHPFDADGGVFNVAWMQRYKTLPDSERVVKVTISVDCANKATERSDYTAISVWNQTDDGRHYLVNMVRKRMEFTDMTNMVNLLAKRYGAHEILVEDAGAGTQYIQTQSGRDGRKRKAPAPVTPIPTSPKDKKSFRLDGCVPMIQAGEVVFPEKAEWVPDMEHEFAAFPDGAHDDQVDSVTQYLIRQVKKSSNGTVKASRKKSKRRRDLEEALERDKPTTNYIGKPTHLMEHNGGPPMAEG